MCRFSFRDSMKRALRLLPERGSATLRAQLSGVVVAWGTTTSFISRSTDCKIMKILIAEDDALPRWYLKSLLINWGYEVMECENGSDAWQTYLAGDYQLVISDWAMPEMDGVELCRRIRAAKRNDRCYFILLSSRVGQTGFTEELDAGIDVYLSKPLNAEVLKSQMRMAEFLFALRSGAKNVQALLPMCAWCRKSRIGEDIWLEVETLALDAFFTYSICPDCSHQLKAARKSNGTD